MAGLLLPLLVVAGCSQNENNQTTKGKTSIPGSKKERVMMPSFNMQDVRGNTINLANLKGKKVFVNLWASWCPPCRREMPSIENLANAVDTNKAVFVMLSLDDNFEKAKNFIGKENLNLPVYYPAENLPALFNVESIPSTFIFNENGELIKRVDGAENYNSVQFRILLSE